MSVRERERERDGNGKVLELKRSTEEAAKTGFDSDKQTEEAEEEG